MICKSCGKEGAYNHKTTMTFGEGEGQVVIENVPVISCHTCGVDLLDADTLDRLQELWTFLRVIPTNRANERRVNFADYEGRNPDMRIRREDQELVRLAELAGFARRAVLNS